MLKRPVSQDKPHSAMDIMWAVKTGVAADVNLAGDLFSPIITLSRIFGHCPLSYKATTKSSSLPKPSKSVCISREYETLGWRSWWLLWSVLSSIFFISLWTLFVVECCTDFRLHSEQGIAHQIQIMRNISGMERMSAPVLLIAMKIIFIIYAVLQISETLFSWSECRPSKDFLNQWKNLLAKFLLTFPNTSIVSPLKDLKKFRNRMVVLYAFLPASLVAPAIGAGYGEISVSSIVIAIHTAVILLEDTKLILTNRILAESFKQVQLAIRRCRSSERVSHARAVAWGELILLIRRNVQTASEIQKNRQLLLLAGSICVISTLSFIIANIHPQASDALVMKIHISGFVAISIIRICAKVSFAQLVTERESLVAEELAAVETDIDDINLKIQLKFIHDKIVNEPTKVTYGNFVKLDKQLLLLIFTQIVTYFIALMQFAKV